MEQFSRPLQDQNGRAISGATVTVYVSGTSTLAPIFSDNGTTVKSNPFTTGITGLINFYAANGAYDIVASSPRNIFPIDAMKRVILFDGSDGVVASSIAGPASLPAEPCTAGQVFADGDSSSAVFYFCPDGTWQPVGGSTTETMQSVFDRGKSVTNANSVDNALRILDANGDGTALYTDATDGPQIQCVDNNVVGGCTTYTRKLAVGQSVVVKNSSGTAIYTLTEAGVLTLNSTLIKTSQPILVPLNPRGAATGAYESIVTNQPSDYYLTVTDANTDAADFSFPVTAELAGKTTATFRLVGVSKAASPANNIDLDCAMSTYTPGTDTFAAHVTTGEQTALLTPATQNRPVAVTTSAHTINGGALVAGDVVHGSCEVDATATTSAQLTDFRLWGWVLITLQ